ncbi:tellurium resistance protein TerF [Bacillus idriensis]|uniref:Tellurium resistance protein TerF n=1 Tax=Metabacillus idriensis TaxID=324768 RepID=A0A6I2M6J6_9BACI|nr:VWA domain-containing protein [Metabacillus idriensis]MRX53137.1 tellurium resistance protein TerF [Metabacillus idriensis]
MIKNEVKLSKGGNTLAGNGGSIDIHISWEYAPCDLDISCFMVGSNGNVPSDDYMIFYNQPADPQSIVTFKRASDQSAVFTIQLDQLENSLAEKCIFAATLDGESAAFKEVKGCSVSIITAESEITYEVTDAGDEKALVLAELYPHSTGYKLRAIGRGFNGGLKPLAEAHGVTVEEESDVAEEIKGEHVKQAPINLTKIDLLKKKVVISLEKKKIPHVKARVAVVIDASGSMANLYSNGTVQSAFEKVLAVAACMDDDGVMDTWFFGSKSMRAKSVTESEFEGYVERTYPRPKFFGGLGIGNNEPEVMKDVIRKYTEEEPSDSLPTYVVFFSDGGIYEDKKISKLLIDCSNQNIFWQFVGLGNANFGVLQKLDDLTGRVVDNADFFALDDLNEATDKELYNRLLNEFPDWLKQSRSKGILR